MLKKKKKKSLMGLKPRRQGDHRYHKGKLGWSPALSSHPCELLAKKLDQEVKVMITGGKPGLAHFSAPVGTARPRRGLCGDGHRLQCVTARVRILALGL